MISQKGSVRKENRLKSRRDTSWILLKKIMGWRRNAAREGRYTRSRTTS